MKLHSNQYVTSVLAEEDIIKLKTCSKETAYCLKLLTKILEHRLSQFEFVDIDSPNWTEKRAMYDGRVKELRWLINNLTEER